MTNFILLLGLTIGIAGIAALAITAFIKWVAVNPLFWIGGLIGAVIATIITVKVRNYQDGEFIKNYRRKQNRAPTPQPAKQPEPITAQTETNVNDLAEALVRYGYLKSEAKEAIKYVVRTMPESSEEDIIKAAIHYLSDDKVMQ